MGFIYNMGIRIVHLGLKCLAPVNKKIDQGVVGRSDSFKKLKNKIGPNDKTLWFHCASLGEYEQGLPVFKALRTHYKAHKIVLTFFSPSGYEIRKHAPIADIVVYLPLDTKTNAKRFVNLVHPELTVFVKYDIWPNFLNALKTNNLRAILISASFRKNQSFFKFYGSILRKALFAFDHIFTQNDLSKALLQSIHYNNVSVSGDTRFDRVFSQLSQDNNLTAIETFKNQQFCIVAGSTWPEDDALFINYINAYPANNLKLIIAPHNLKASQIKDIQEKLTVETVLFSNSSNKQLKTSKVFIIDTIGLLSKIYSYADVAYVGGAMGHTGLHNTLEPAVFGVPIIIGNNHTKFPEAKAMIAIDGMFAVSNQDEFNTILNALITDAKKRLNAGTANLEYIKQHTGAVDHICNYLGI